MIGEKRFETTFDGVTAWAEPWVLESPVKGTLYDRMTCQIWAQSDEGANKSVLVVIEPWTDACDVSWKPLQGATLAEVDVMGCVLRDAVALARVEAAAAPPCPLCHSTDRVRRSRYPEHGAFKCKEGPDSMGCDLYFTPHDQAEEAKP